MQRLLKEPTANSGRGIKAKIRRDPEVLTLSLFTEAL